MALQYMTECAVCRLEFRDPKILPCDHTFCQSCMTQLKQGSRIKCPLCKRSHEFAEVRSDFRLQQLLDVLREKELENEVVSHTGVTRCGLCSSAESSSHWCEECERWMCRDCLKTHLRIPICRHHTVVHISKKNTEVVEKIERQSIPVRNNIEEYKNLIDKLQSTMKQLVLKQSESIETSNALRAEILQDVNEFFDMLNAKIADYIRGRMSELEGQKETLEKDLSDIESQWQAISNILEEQNATIAINGEQILEQVKELSTLIPKVSDTSMSEVSVEMLQGKTWNVQTAAKLKICDGGKCVYVFASQENNLSSLCHSEFKIEKQCTLANEPWNVREIRGQLWSCEKNGTIELFDKELELQATLMDDKWGYVKDVAEMPTLVVASINGLFHTTLDGKELDTIDTGDFTSAVFHENKLYAREYTSSSVYIYKYNGAWDNINVINIPHPYYGYNSLCINSNQIVTCYHTYKAFWLLSLSGEILYKHDIKDLFTDLHISQYDDEESILVTSNYRHPLQVIDSANQRHVVNLQPQLKRPRRALYQGGKLYAVSAAEPYQLVVYAKE